MSFDKKDSKLKVCVINGSPRGKYSITLQTSLFLQKKFSEADFDFVEVASRINSLEKDLETVKSSLEGADLILFSYPVYTFICPSQLHRFIAALKKSKINLEGKFATQISTSKHFYDVTAHNYIEDNCFDMKMKVIHGLSADMEDLLSESGQKNAEDFFNFVLDCVRRDVYERNPHPQSLPKPYESTIEKKDVIEAKSNDYEMVIVADLKEEDKSLKAMIDDFVSVFPYKTRLVNIADYPFKGGCLGCFNCAGDGKCIYNDGFDTFLRQEIQRAASIVIAFSISDHSMGPRFKMYDDRQFCNGHRTVTEGMSFGYIVNGDYKNEPNLQTIIDARSQVGGNYLAGVGYDSSTIKAMSERMVYALKTQYVLPRNFYGVGGMKIFRDLIWLMRGLMKSDHEFYKKHGIYDFPQKQTGKMLKMCLLGSLVRNPKIKAKMGNKMNEGMVAPYKKIIDSL